MLRAVGDLLGHPVSASDGDIGFVSRFLFDDDRWAIRHIVIDIGTWLTGRRVLISPAAVERFDDAAQRMVTRLTKEQIHSSPDIDVDQPVSRQQEIALHAHYGYGPYWGDTGLWGAGYQPHSLLTSPMRPMTAAPPAAPAGDRDPEGPQLRSTKEVVGYRFRAAEGEIGSVSDIALDDESWAIRYVVVELWRPDRRVLVPAGWVREVDWARAQVEVDQGAEAVRGRPEYRQGELAVHAAQRAHSNARVYHVNDVIGKSVVTAATGEKLGHISDALMDTTARRLVGFVIGRSALGCEHVLPLADVQTVGHDTLLVGTADHLMTPREWRRSDVDATRCTAIHGRRVVTTEGRQIGHASDLLVEERTGALGGIEVEERTFGGLRHRRHVIAGTPAPHIGPDAIVVSMPESHDTHQK